MKPPQMDEQPSKESTNLRHEPIETDVRAVWRAGAVLAGVVIGSFLLVVGLMNWFAETEGGTPAEKIGRPESGWTQPEQLQQLRFQERQLLGTYQWVDRANGIARIPIERAMQIVSNEGLPKAPSSPAAAISSPQQGAKSDNSTAPAENGQP